MQVETQTRVTVEKREKLDIFDSITGDKTQFLSFVFRSVTLPFDLNVEDRYFINPTFPKLKSFELEIYI